MPYSIDPDHNIPSFRARKIWHMLGALNIKKLYKNKFISPSTYNNNELISICIGHKELGYGVDLYTSSKCLINYYDG